MRIDARGRPSTSRDSRAAQRGRGVSSEQGPRAEGLGMRADANRRYEADARTVERHSPYKEAEDRIGLAFIGVVPVVLLSWPFLPDFALTGSLPDDRQRARLK